LTVFRNEYAYYRRRTATARRWVFTQGFRVSPIGGIINDASRALDVDGDGLYGLLTTQGAYGLGDTAAQFDGTSNTKVAQSFQVSKAIAQVKLQIDIPYSGLPTDNIQVQICSDSSGVPGSVLATTTISGAYAINRFDNGLFTEATFQNIPLSASTTYWFVFSRTGSADATNTFKLDINVSGGTYSASRFNGTSWLSTGYGVFRVIEAGDSSYGCGAVAQI
jgi:hypothetical protein